MRATESADYRLVYAPCLEWLPYGSALWQVESSMTPTQERLCEALTRALYQVLTDKQREVIQLYFYEGLTQPEIARRLGISQQVVSKRIYGTRRNGKMVGGALAKLKRALS